MYGHKATGGHSLGGGLYSSGPSRRGPLRRALARLWPGKRLGALLALVLLLCYGMYRATRDSPEIAAEKQRQLARCTAMPWLPACASTTRGGYSRASRQGGATNKKRDPFAGLEYKQEGGHLFYPALESSPALNVTVPRGEERPGQPHPIHKLMRDAEESWRRKQARQSRSLKDAVAEYERRCTWWRGCSAKDGWLNEPYNLVRWVAASEGLQRLVLVRERSKRGAHRRVRLDL